MIDAQEDAHHPDSEQLMALALGVAERARTIDLAALGARQPSAARALDLWPGEHYRFLAALVALLAPQSVVEIGTHLGMGALALASALPPGGKVVTFDVVPWRSFAGSLIVDSDLGQVEPRLGDLGDDGIFAANQELIAAADLIFVDGPKDGRFEPRLHERLAETVKAGSLVVYDDIRLLTMVELWRSIAVPKFDATSLAHWTGTGMVAYRGIPTLAGDG